MMLTSESSSNGFHLLTLAQPGTLHHAHYDILKTEDSRSCVSGYRIANDQVRNKHPAVSPCPQKVHVGAKNKYMSSQSHRVSLMTPPPTPRKRVRITAHEQRSRSKSESKRRRVIQNELEIATKKAKQRRKPDSATEVSVPSECHHGGSGAYELKKSHETYSDRPGEQSDVYGGSERCESRISVPWFVHPKYKDLSFSSLDDATESGACESNRSKKDEISSKHQCVRGYVEEDEGKLGFTSCALADVATMPPFQPETESESPCDSEEEHEFELERLLANIPTTKSLQPHAAHVITFNNIQKSHKHQLGNEDFHGFIPPQKLIDPNAIDAVNATYSFILALQHEQDILTKRARSLSDKAQKAKLTTTPRNKKRLAKINRLEQALVLTELLCSDLFIAEYAFRDLLHENKENSRFDLVTPLRGLQIEVGSLVEAFDTAMAEI